jgi:hypothetical protein
MRKKIALILLVSFTFQTFAAIASVGRPLAVGPESNPKYKAMVEMLKKISVMDLKSYETLTGKHLNFISRTVFKMTQRKLRKSFDEEGNVTNKKLNKMLSKGSSDGETGFHLGGFALGFFVGLIGVLIAYVAFSDDNKRNRIKWAWIGVGVSLVLSLILFLVVFNSVKNSI